MSNTPVTFDRFANAPVLPFGMGHDWMSRARTVWRRHVGFLLLATLAVLIARWQLDFLDGAVIIVLSYLSDAVVFTWVFLGLQRQSAQPDETALLAGWRALRGRWKAVLLSSLWGLPAAGASFVLFYFGPQLIEALVLAVGVNLIGVATLLLLVLVAAYLTFLLCLLPVLAGIHAARDEHAGFRVGGLWAYRALRSGWRPLLVVFMVFLTGCAVAATVLTWCVGHLPVAWFAGDSSFLEGLWYWYPWPGLLLAMNFFLALLLPMVGDLLHAADTDLSDEITTAQHKEREGQQFVRIVFRRTAFAIRSAAALCVLFGVIYSTVLGDMQQLLDWLGVALLLYLAGGLVYRWSNRWKPVVTAQVVSVGESGAVVSAMDGAVQVQALAPVALWRRLLAWLMLYPVSVILILGGASTMLQGVDALGDRSVAVFATAVIMIGGGSLVVGLLMFWGARVLTRPKKQTPPAEAGGA